MTVDLLATVEQGGCSAKLSANQLRQVLQGLPAITHERLLVDISTHDDAGVYQLSDELALIQTTDFFPPICSDPYTFGQIAAANALSDVYAMGGTPLTALNLMMFPADSLPLDALREILRGGQDKVAESGAVVVGGHTVVDSLPKYGLAVTGVVHPQQVVTNAAARPGDRLILTKPLGTGVLVAAQRLGLAEQGSYNSALASMKQLNRAASEIMVQFGIRCATDITGFGLLGHALKLAQASGVSLRLDSQALPCLPQVLALTDHGCIPSACFRNLDFVEAECAFAAHLDYNRKLCATDAQTSGGMLMAVPAAIAETVLAELKSHGCPQVAMVGEVLSSLEKRIVLE